VWGGGSWTWPKILLSHRYQVQTLTLMDLSWWQTNGACKIWSKNPVGGPGESSGLIQGYIMSIQEFDNQIYFINFLELIQRYYDSTCICISSYFGEIIYFELLPIVNMCKV
jgi:hypothetical protein